MTMIRTTPIGTTNRPIRPDATHTYPARRRADVGRRVNAERRPGDGFLPSWQSSDRPVGRAVEVFLESVPSVPIRTSVTLVTQAGDGSGLVHIGRQPIYDRAGEVVAYELLFRGARTASQAGKSDAYATTQVILNAFAEFGLEQIVGDKRCLLNMTREFLVGDLPLPFEPDRVVLEVLETVEIDDEVIAGVAALAGPRLPDRARRLRVGQRARAAAGARVVREAGRARRGPGDGRGGGVRRAASTRTSSCSPSASRPSRSWRRSASSDSTSSRATSSPARRR